MSIEETLKYKVRRCEAFQPICGRVGCHLCDIDPERYLNELEKEVDEYTAVMDAVEGALISIKEEPDFTHALKGKGPLGWEGDV